jgi:hypothetical protein
VPLIRTVARTAPVQIAQVSGRPHDVRMEVITVTRITRQAIIPITATTVEGVAAEMVVATEEVAVTEPNTPAWSRAMRVPVAGDVSPNKHLLRTGTHKVLGRGRAAATPCRAARARALLAQPTGADVGRYTALRVSCLLAVVLLIGVLPMTESKAAAPAVTKYGERNAKAPAELDAFSFLVGKWEGTGSTKLPDGKVAEFAVGWIGRYVLDGMAIADEFHSSMPDGSPYLGISLRQYRADLKSWVIEYLNVTNSFLRKQVSGTSGAVSRNGNSVVVLSQSPDAWSRETYTLSAPGRFSYSIDISTDSGKTWTLGQMQIAFLRRE